jgi:hypothetical protein
VNCVYGVIGEVGDSGLDIASSPGRNEAIDYFWGSRMQLSIPSTTTLPNRPGTKIEMETNP